VQYAGASDRAIMIDEILGKATESPALLMMMKDQYANYVIQKILDVADDSQRSILISKIRPHISALKKYTYGKHIIARVEQYIGKQNS